MFKPDYRINLAVLERRVPGVSRPIQYLLATQDQGDRRVMMEVDLHPHDEASDYLGQPTAVYTADALRKLLDGIEPLPPGRSVVKP